VNGWVALPAAVVAVAALAMAWWLRRTFVAITVAGGSMSPTLATGDRVLIRRGTRGLRRGHIVVVARPDLETGWRHNPPVDGLRGTRWYIKRAVALAGDEYPDGVGGGGTVSDGYLVLLGDNPRSVDSKQYGPCPRDQILGVMVRRLS
jgi:signal peptidase I